MEKILTSLPGIITAWGLLAGTIIGGLLYFLGLFDKRKTTKKKTEDETEDRLIKLLATNRDELENRITKQEKIHADEVKGLNQRIDGLQKTVEDLKRDNETLTKVLQGRDDQTQEFYKQGFAAMKINLETNAIIKEVATGIKSQNDNMSKLIDLMGKQIDAGKEVGHSIIEAAKLPVA